MINMVSFKSSDNHKILFHNSVTLILNVRTLRISIDMLLLRKDLALYK